MPGAPVPDDIESQYNPRKAVPDAERFAQRAAALSAATRARGGGRLDLRYGDGRLATLDVFPAAVPDAPLHVFLHGGYWRGRDKSDYSYVADALVPLGITTVVMNYDLCPAVELPAIVRQVREGLQWVHAHARELGGDPAALTASGHSAGAHLIAAALPPAGQPLPAWAPRAAVLVSGIYELEPVLSISVNQEIRLRPEQVDAMSPMRHPPTPAVPLLVAAGGAEPAGWLGQSRDFARACAGAGAAAAFVELPGTHHYSVMNALETPDGMLARLIEAIARPRAARA
ncbi:alpha/beta hydrolase [Ramlibacter tataouinensis]|uniref:Candidate Esterase/lipase n=1 Tax=Ramlibacter tataouinensis (strain ATCC BAA-407 / DSM 14655 / LMG 21543 / TTB310) TaxID=365046 RepID=F5Y421_RAMTT|nr:alpha/beta hydrolase [Ramlibacter tataouinensis]AEG91299.1 Candidate Esterase/lipase [Ramlibacter tataouinensis TTB310]